MPFGSVVRRNFLRRVGFGRGGGSAAHLLVQRAELFLQQVDLLLLARHGAVQGIQQVFLEGELDFEFVEAIVHG
ncbi:hypothetical protein CBM2585_B20456 [Cupriavidus taiwanensis]|nr:hypothetical protein CBM2585_B20456 [Cupriavidus taiwanensis]